MIIRIEKAKSLARVHTHTHTHTHTSNLIEEYKRIKDSIKPFGNYSNTE